MTNDHGMVRYEPVVQGYYFAKRRGHRHTLPPVYGALAVACDKK